MKAAKLLVALFVLLASVVSSGRAGDQVIKKTTPLSAFSECCPPPCPPLCP